MLKTRINALPTRAQTTRSRVQNRRCRAGCKSSEALNHVLKMCPRTHNIRVKRHDALVRYLAIIQPEGASVVVEPRLRTNESIRKPDLLISINNTMIVVNAQIVGGQQDLGLAHRRKSAYYRDINSMDVLIKKRTGRQNNFFTSWKGLYGVRPLPRTFCSTS